MSAAEVLVLIGKGLAALAAAGAKVLAGGDPDEALAELERDGVTIVSRETDAVLAEGDADVLD